MDIQVEKVWRFLENQQAQIDLLRAQQDALGEENQALRTCLENAGIIAKATFSTKLGRRRQHSADPVYGRESAESIFANRTQRSMSPAAVLSVSSGCASADRFRRLPAISPLPHLGDSSSTGRSSSARSRSPMTGLCTGPCNCAGRSDVDSRSSGQSLPPLPPTPQELRPSLPWERERQSSSSHQGRRPSPPKEEHPVFAVSLEVIQKSSNGASSGSNAPRKAMTFATNSVMLGINSQPNHMRSLPRSPCEGAVLPLFSPPCMYTAGPTLGWCNGDDVTSRRQWIPRTPAHSNRTLCEQTCIGIGIGIGGLSESLPVYDDWDSEWGSEAVSPNMSSASPAKSVCMASTQDLSRSLKRSGLDKQSSLSRNFSADCLPI